MRQKIGRWKVGAVVLLLLAVYAKVVKAYNPYAQSSKLSVFSSNNNYY